MNNTSKISISFIIVCGIIIFLWGLYPIPQPEWLKFVALITGPLLTISAITLNKKIQNVNKDK